MSSVFFLKASQSYSDCQQTSRSQTARAVPIGLLICFLFPALLFSQAKPMKWGEVPRADLEMVKFPEDSNAAAVILGDYGEVYFDEHVNMVFTRHRRIKILAAAGYEWGSHSVDYIAEARREWVSGLEGQTFKLAADGSVRVDKLDKSAIFDEEASEGLHRIRFTLPALAPGAVVEYPALREFYDRLVALQAENIVLKRETLTSTVTKP